MKKEFKAHFIMLKKVAKPFVFVWVFNRLRDIFLYLSKREISNIFWREVILLLLLFITAKITLKSYAISIEKGLFSIKKGVIIKRIIKIEFCNISSFKIIRNPVNVITKSTKLVFGCQTNYLKKKELFFVLKKEDANTLIKMYKKYSTAK